MSDGVPSRTFYVLYSNDISRSDRVVGVGNVKLFATLKMLWANSQRYKRATGSMESRYLL